MESCAKLLTDADRTDKVYRTIQYICKLWYSTDWGGPEVLKRVNRLARVLSSTRQVLRLGKSIQVWNKLRFQPKLEDNTSHILIRLCDSSFFFYFYLTTLPGYIVQVW
eukprot:jgi/Galph1/1908/GphlegSOOS_G24.1